MKTKLLLFLLIPISSFSQIINQQKSNKEIAQSKSKEYLFKNVLKLENETVKFVIDFLSSASSDEMTTLYYNCEEQEKEGLILGFFGNYLNDFGVEYRSFAFKNFEKKEAIEFLTKIRNAIDSNKQYLKDNSDNNIILKYQDIDILISTSSQTVYQIRLFWKGFDSSWDALAFNGSMRRLNYKLNNK